MSDLDYNPTNFTRSDYEDARRRRQRGERLTPADKAVLFTYEQVAEPVKSLFQDVSAVGSEMGQMAADSFQQVMGDTSTAEAATGFAEMLEDDKVMNRGDTARAPLVGGSEPRDLLSPPPDVAAAREAGADYARGDSQAQRAAWAAAQAQPSGEEATRMNARESRIERIGRWFGPEERDFMPAVLEGMSDQQLNETLQQLMQINQEEYEAASGPRADLKARDTNIRARAREIFGRLRGNR